MHVYLSHNFRVRFNVRAMLINQTFSFSVIIQNGVQSVMTLDNSKVVKIALRLNL